MKYFWRLGVLFTIRICNFDVMTYLWRHDVLWRNDIICPFYVMTYYLETWRTFWRHYVYFDVMTYFFWCHTTFMTSFYDVITYYMTPCRTFDIMTYFWHDVLFGNMTYLLRHIVLLTSYALFDVRMFFMS